MSSNTLNNQQTLDTIRSGKEGRDKILVSLYRDEKLKRSIVGMIIKNGGDEESAMQVFNNALIQFVKTVIKKQEMTIDTSIHQYIIGIARFLWYKEIADKKKHRSEELQSYHEGTDDIQPESLVIFQEKKHLLTALLDKLGRNCKEVLMYWANGYRMKAIAEMMGYQSEGMAKKKKYQCMKELLKYVENNPSIKSALR